MDTQTIDTIFSIGILLFSVVVHEVSHGYMALFLGDKTALNAGRLTLNPLKHIDPIWTVLVPILTYGSGFMFGMAKPVPYNPYNLRDQRWGDAKVAIAGPGANFVIAIVFGLLLRIFASFWNAHELSNILYTIVGTNVFLGVFNLFPIPPLDGSKVFFSFLPYQYRHVEDMLNRYSLPLLLVLIFFLWRFVEPLVYFIIRLIIGG